MIIEKRFLEHLIEPWIFADNKGRILDKNAPAESVLRSAGLPSIGRITEIDPLFGDDSGTFLNSPRTLPIGKIKRRIKVYPVELDGREDGFLYLFEVSETLKLIDFDTFLDHIDAGIAIVSRDGTLEHVNTSLSKFIGVNVKEWIGRSVCEMVEEGLLTESATVKTLAEKKAITMNVTYGSGTTLQYRDIPVFDDKQNIQKVIGTARDVTRMIQLESDLASSESLKDKYYKRLNTLEVFLGGDRIVYSSEPMRRVVEIAVKAGKFDSPVFLWGESGVGKEMIAKLIHQTGKRNQGPFIGVNCSAIPSELLEAEFFGYEEGAFTGAKKGGRRGLFDEAEKGTLFLDEITELPRGMQSKLLRVIQEREYMRVGSSKTTPTDVRIIASTNLTGEEILGGAGFRRDLFYRLSVVPIHIPPLRDRRDDILPLIRFSLKELNLKYDAHVKIANSLLPRFHNYDWPGNVRELRNFIERLIVVSGSEEVGEEEFNLVNQLELQKTPIASEDISISRLMPLKEAVDQLEEILFRRAYQESRNIEKTAELLGVDPSTIHRKIKKGKIQLK